MAYCNVELRSIIFSSLFSCWSRITFCSTVWVPNQLSSQQVGYIWLNRSKRYTPLTVSDADNGFLILCQKCEGNSWHPGQQLAVGGLNDNRHIAHR